MTDILAGFNKAASGKNVSRSSKGDPNDMFAILQRLDETKEGPGTPTLGAKAKIPNISPVLGTNKPIKHPLDGYLVGEDVEDLRELGDRAERDHEVQMARSDLYKIAKYAMKLHSMLKNVSEEEGIEGWKQSKITKAADYIGSVYHSLDYETNVEDEVVIQTEDILSQLQAEIGDVLSDVSDSLDDKDIQDMMPDKGDTLGTIVKTITTDDGRDIKITGNEDDGFRVVIKDKTSESSFANLEEASMAVEMYCARNAK
jgi:hypothetical protein